MDKKLLILQGLGFKPAGQWVHNGIRLKYELLTDIRARRNVIYAFAEDDMLAYIGITINTLDDRLRPYVYPAKSKENGGGTNIKNNQNLRASLGAGKRLDIYAFVDAFTDEQCALPTRPLHWLENYLIEVLDPPWNDPPHRRGRPAPALVPS